MPSRDGAARAIRVLVALLSACLASALVCAACTEAPRPLPNVLVIVMDTTRADRCSFLGYDRPTTPRLAELARESVVFRDAWSPAPWTFPAHAALFTGRTPEALGIVRAWPAHLDRRAPVLAELLKAAGWDTGCFTGNAWIAPHSGLSRGFGVLDDLHLSTDATPSRRTHERALSWMTARAHAGKRFFAFVNDIEPHAPWSPPKEFAASFLPAKADPADVAEAAALCYPGTMRAYLQGTAPREGVRAAASGLYDAEIAQLDAEIGRMMDALRASGLLETTLVVVTADHGEGLGAHGLLEHGVRLDRELLRVPLLVRPPGGCAGRTVSDVVRLEDVFATVLDACDVPLPGAAEGLGDLDSRSLLGDTSGRVARAAELTRLDICEASEAALSVELARPLRVTRRSIYDGRRHLIVGDDDSVELFAPADDPAETRNLAASEPETVRSLRARIGAAGRGPTGGK